MGKPKTDNLIIKQIIKLRKEGSTVMEIKEITGKGVATISRYIKNVDMLPFNKKRIRAKQGGSVERSKKHWRDASIKATKLLGKLNDRDLLFILAALYWGEGNKTELNLNNSDPALIKIFAKCLKQIGVNKDDLRVTIRLFEDINKEDAKIFWAKLLEIPTDKILGINILKGKKKGKLKYGMCRIRVKKGAPYFKLIISMIDFIKSELDAAVVQWIERGTPKP